MGDARLGSVLTLGRVTVPDDVLAVVVADASATGETRWVWDDGVRWVSTDVPGFLPHWGCVVAVHADGSAAVVEVIA